MVDIVISIHGLMISIFSKLHCNPRFSFDRSQVSFTDSLQLNKNKNKNSEREKFKLFRFFFTHAIEFFYYARVVHPSVRLILREEMTSAAKIDKILPFCVEINTSALSRALSFAYCLAK